MKNECLEVIEKLVNKNFNNWKGLGPYCSINETFKVLVPQGKGSSKGFLGNKTVEYSNVLCTYPTFQHPLRVWYTTEIIIRIDAFFPDIDIKAEKFVREMGLPKNKSDYYFGGILFKDAEWIYADKGITAMLNGDLDKIIQIYIYRPVSIQIYNEEIKTFLPSREFDD